MYLFFEEDGTFKVGTILSQNGSAYQVELLTGRRTKVKGGHVFFEFESPVASDVMPKAEAMSTEIDPQFLWEVAPEGEFRFETLAVEYFGEAASVIEKIATLLTLHNHPVYFHRKGRGNYRKAPEEILKAALAALEKKRLAEEQKKAWVRQMIDEQTAPKEIVSQAINLLVSPDKNSNLWKALSDAASEARMTPLRLLLSLGAIKSAYRWHIDSFYAQYFPKGKGFAADLVKPSEMVGMISLLPMSKLSPLMTRQQQKLTTRQVLSMLMTGFFESVYTLRRRDLELSVTAISTA